MSTKHEKQLLIESCDFAPRIDMTKELKESISLSAGKNNTLIVRNIPTTILNRENLNGRIYSTDVLKQAIIEAKDKIARKELLCQSCEHPEGSYCSPTTASHVVINAYIKENVDIEVSGERGRFDVLFMDFEVVNTEEGKNLRALLEAGCSLGLSIRGLGDMNGNLVENYDLLGCDIVGNPSSSTYTNMPVNESVIVESRSVEDTSKDLKEKFVISTSSTNTVHDLDSAAKIQTQLDNANYGTVVKTATKLEDETNPKTGVITTLVTLESETSDETNDLNQALGLAKKAILNPLVHVDSVTIENIEEEGETKESVDAEGAPIAEDYMSDEEIAKQYEGFEVKGIEKQGESSGWITIAFPNADGVDFDTERTTGFIVYDNGKVAFDDWFPTKVYNKLSDIIKAYITDSMNESAEEKEKFVVIMNKNDGDESSEEVEFENKEKAIEYATKQAMNSDIYDFANVCRVSPILNYDTKEYEDNYELLAQIDKNGHAEMFESKAVKEDTVKQDGKWVNKGSEGTHGKFNTKKAADAQRKAMFANGYKESAEDDKINNKPRKFVLKTPNGYVAMNGNAINFVKKPSEALQFLEGKEESGIVHLSNIEKILDTMGIYDVERYFKREGMGRKKEQVKQEVSPIANDKQQSLIPENNALDGTPAIDMHGPVVTNITEDANSSKYVAIVYSNNGQDQSTTPVTATEVDGVLAEVKNLFEMKQKSLGNNIQMVVKDNETGMQWLFNPKTSTMDKMQESFGDEDKKDDVKVDDNKVSMTVDDNLEIEKEFDNPQEAKLVKAGIDNEKIDPAILVQEDAEKKSYIIYTKTPAGRIYIIEDTTNGELETIDEEELAELKAQGISLSELGYATKEEADKIMSDLNNAPGFDDIEFKVEETSDSLDEKLFKNPSPASDEYVREPLKDDAEMDIPANAMITLNNIDWDLTADDIQSLMNLPSDGSEKSIEEVFAELVANLPDSVTISVSPKKLEDAENVEQVIFDEISQQHTLPPVKKADIIKVEG